MNRNVFKEIIPVKFLNLGRELDILIYKASRSPYYLNAERPSPRQVIMKLSKIKDKCKILKKNLVTYKGAPIRLSVDFSTETLQAWRKRDNIFKVRKKRKKNTSQEYTISLNYPSDMKEK